LTDFDKQEKKTMSSPVRGKIKTPDGRIVEITDQEFQYGRWWNKKIDQFNREIYSLRNPMRWRKAASCSSSISSASSPPSGRKIARSLSSGTLDRADFGGRVPEQAPRDRWLRSATLPETPSGRRNHSGP
jgi:hypothetical protein